MARQSLDPSPEASAPSAGETSLPTDPARSTWLIQLSILDFPVQVGFGACSWSKAHSPYGRPAIAAKRGANATPTKTQEPIRRSNMTLPRALTPTGALDPLPFAIGKVCDRAVLPRLPLRDSSRSVPPRAAWPSGRAGWFRISPGGGATAAWS